MGILRTKLVPPVELERLVDRPRLLGRLDDIRQARLTLLLAAAGYGKSCLLSQWYHALKAEGASCGWFSADGSEGDAVALLTYIGTALGDAGVRHQPSLERVLQTDVFASTDFIVDILIQAVERSGGERYLFIDDAHLLPPEAMAGLARMVERAPASLRFVIASRALPDLHLARARAHGELLELHAEDLRFTAEETRRYLAHPDREPPEEQDVSALEARTEGWIAGIKLAMLATRRGVSQRELLASFGGSNRSVSDFFAEEVFTAQPAEIQDFLLKTSVLDRFCPGLCAAVTGRADARELLYQTEERGLFLIRLDEDRNWYRYHHLFAGFLRRRLAEAEPKAAQALHLKASHWYWDDGQPVEAIIHALKADAPLRAADLLERRCQELTYVGKIRLVSKYAEQIPEVVLRRYPGILLTLAWRRTRALRFEEAAELIAAADARLAEMESSGEATPQELRRLRYLLLHREMVLMAARDDMVEVDKRCHHLLEEYPEEQHPYLLGTIYGHLLAATREQYKLADLERIAAVAQGVLRRSDYALAAVGLQAGIGPGLFLAGKPEAARQILEEGREEAVHFSGEGSSATAVCSLPLAELLYENNELDRAEALVAGAMPSAREFGFIDQLQAAYVIQARIHAARDATGKAMLVLDEGMAIAIERDLDRLRLALAGERVQLLIRSTRLDEALECALRHGVSLDEPAPQPADFVTTSHERAAMIWVRLALATDRLADAATVARHWRNLCAARGAVRSLIRWDILLAQLNYLAGDPRAAQRALREALTHGASARVLRSFIDEGPLVKTLLSIAGDAGEGAAAPADRFAEELLDAFGGNRRRRPTVPPAEAEEAGLYGKLSAKEREILGLVGSGLSNREIAQRMGMTEGTVKWYLQQIYDKIGTRRRQHAAERARQFGLIAG